jgi:methylamine--corrinoid protein Co-methyltransferase
MLRLLDIAERAQKGPKTEGKDWDLGLFRKMTELTRKYEIHHPGGDAWFSYDDGLAQRLFRAGVEFLYTTGVYCLSTSRVIQFSEEEVLEAAQQAPRQVIVGEDRDQRMIQQRYTEYREPPSLIPGIHAPFQEELAPLMVKNFAQIPSGDFLEGFNFTQVDGREVYGLPLEAYAARREVAWLREGVRKAGRQGMAVALYPISTRAAALVAPMDPEYGLRRTDGIMLSVLPDVKVELDLLTAAIVYHDYGCFGVNGGGGGGVGGFCGGLEGAMIEGIVKPLVGWIVYRDGLSYASVGSMRTGAVKPLHVQPDVGWATSAVCQALNNHTGLTLFSGGSTGIDRRSGPGRQTHLYAYAMSAIQSVLNGCNLFTFGAGRAPMNSRKTPLEAELMYDTARGVQLAGIDRGKGGEVLRALAEKVEGRFPESGIPITETYDLVHHRPKPAYEEMYLQLKGHLVELGVALD